MWALYFMNIVRVKTEFPHCITTILKQKLQHLKKRADWPVGSEVQTIVM